jgi:hypothetical protein
MMSEDRSRIEERMTDTVRLIIGRRERAPRSPRMERALKQIIWRYNRAIQASTTRGHADVQE